MLDTILKAIDSFIWGPPLLILLAGVGIYFTFKLQLIQIFRLPRALKYIFKPEKGENQKGDISAFASLATALAATIGTGNIVGVATAIQAGGPGALFWMWIIAIFGMATKYAEGLLAIKFRGRDKDGFISGGPMYYIEMGMGQKWKWLAKLFALFGVMVAFFGIGTFPQINGITHALHDTFSVPIFISGIILTACVAAIILGGVKRISKIASIVVPFMAFAYILVSVVILVLNADKLPETIVFIVKMAFNPESAVSGALGFTVMQAIQSGVARGIFSNESGLGSAPIAAAAAQTNEPVRQGLISMTGTFLDTIIVCTMTGLVIVLTGTWQGDVEGAALTNLAFSTGLSNSFGSIVVTVGLVFFAFTTILGWCYYGERCFVYLTGGRTKGIKFYRIVFIVLIAVAPMIKLQTIWTIADIVNGLMAFPNLIALIALRHIIIDETKGYFERMKQQNG
ncbi:alanine/glycine:cation symporter family protein [Phocoenobacter skyensis]|uniref:Alanine or glycine:cation symporter, AGCS family n=1 Tax=Phocoenobacter skyensis TaxID=97481 RepID=A0A1H7VBB1_9PAST|nr:sodium:alanine symporter family protein [Pasteurella skyensis]MDP8078385.1 sodium:alanine symporter family protein [Pasteurella skyensis]MDP8084523.1 sodium:alanine symporter family protein [Pasteurella skyensis]MDP8170288.1 sodium:alanine symporter family protein [Pasteurella skyensis]MDP8174380.1 sodium:alanine symporter family protein [Pasteurella skyensis]MDP8184352.1 sodium:alanine symporter family protein [Pasteurella skyensis]